VARAHRARQLAAWARPPEEVTLPSTAAARYARATEIHRQIGELVATLADTASGQQALFETAASRKPVRATIKKLNKLTSELAALAVAASLR
jgi:alkylhydroperoxidase/carboxymuconolactone decarboxylase family protein YurZ